MTARWLRIETRRAIDERKGRGAVKAGRQRAGCAFPAGEVADAALKGIMLRNFKGSLGVGEGGKS